MKSNRYHFVTHWKVEATPVEVYEILEQAEQLPRWWPAVYLEVKTTKENDRTGTGREVSLYTKGWLPYTLRWQSRLSTKNPPHGFSIEAFGDLRGRGTWSFERDEDGIHCYITYDWQVEATKPILRYFSFLLKPVFSANHHWAMRTGEESLRLELQRRKARTLEERNSIATPPRPTFAWLIK
ncbi:MAG: SRPBCC family protein [Saprospiraceae bacterium]|nr:SRPBCC family protein [Saprospiraceae bacterium]